MEGYVELAAWLAPSLALVATMAALTTRSPVRAALGAVVVAAALALPYVAPRQNALRFWLGMSSVLGAMVWLELVREKRTSPWWMRVWMSLTPTDVRNAERQPPAVDGKDLAMTLLYAALAALGWWVAYPVADSLEGPTHLAVRWLGALIFGYCLFDALVHVLRNFYRALGVRLPRMHDAPILSRTVGEMWSRRWNQTVHIWLTRHFFRPLARRRRPILGVIAAFVASAFLHAMIFLPAMGWTMAACMGGFFLAQGVVVLLERRVGITRWPEPAQRVWFVGWMLLTAPLFLEPFARVLE